MLAAGTGLISCAPPLAESPQVSGALIRLEFRTQAECDKYMYSVNRVIQPHWDNWVKYDPEIDGCVLPIFANESLPKLRDDDEWVLAPTEGRV